MSDVTNGKGGIVAVTDAEQLIRIDTPTRGKNMETAMTLKVWNTGSTVVYATVNEELANFTIATAIPIPADSSFPFIGQPINKLILACATGETGTANYGAY